MAGHNFSGYISSLWQALFAAFTQLFTRIFHFTSSNTTSSNQHPPAPAPPAGQLSDSPNSNTAASDSPATASHLNHPPDLEKGPPQQEDDAMAAKKRGGHKRSSVNSNGAQPANTSSAPDAQQRDKENMYPGKHINQSTISSVSPENSKAPLGASNQTGNLDAGRKTIDSNILDKNHAHSSPATAQSGDNVKKDDPASGLETPNITVTLTPPTTAVVPAEDKIEIQKAGSHSPHGTQPPNSAKTPSTSKEGIANATVDQAAAAFGGLAINDTPRTEETLIKDTAAVEAAGVPLVVANPAPGQSSMTLKPLAPLVTPPSQVLPGLIEPDTEEGKRERAIHLNFMREALNMGDAALSINETPVGCVLVYKNRIIAKGMNATNITRNGTRHAEFMAISALLSHQSDADIKDVADHDEATWGDVDPADGHIFPYGQKLHPSPKVDRAIISECILYVTVEPCVMCASLLRQLRIKKVYFGAVNDKFGGTGGVFRIHVNSKAVAKPNNDRPYQNGYGPHEIERIQRGRAAVQPRDEDDGDGGNVEPGYPAEGGFLRDEAVSLLRRFYVQENGRAPQPRKKEGRAARLFAMENAAANGGVLTDADGNALPGTPVEGDLPSVNGNSTPALAA